MDFFFLNFMELWEDVSRNECPKTFTWGSILQPQETPWMQRYSDICKRFQNIWWRWVCVLSLALSRRSLFYFAANAVCVVRWTCEMFVSCSWGSAEKLLREIFAKENFIVRQKRRNSCAVQLGIPLIHPVCLYFCFFINN